MVRLRRPPEWGVEPVPPSLRVLRTFDLFVLWSSLGVGLLVLAAGAVLIGGGGFGFGLTLSGSPVGGFVGSVLGCGSRAAPAPHGSPAGAPQPRTARPRPGGRGARLPIRPAILLGDRFDPPGARPRNCDARVLVAAKLGLQPVRAILERFADGDRRGLHDREHGVLHPRGRADGARNRARPAELSGGHRLTWPGCVPAPHYPRGRNGQRVRERLLDRGFTPESGAEATPADVHCRRDRRRDGRGRVPLEPWRGDRRRIRRVPVPDRRFIRAPLWGRHRGFVRGASGGLRARGGLSGCPPGEMGRLCELDSGCRPVFRDCGLCAPDPRAPALVCSPRRAPHLAIPRGVCADEADVGGGQRRALNRAYGPALRTPGQRQPAAMERASRRSGCTWSTYHP